MKKLQVVQSAADHKIFKYEESFYTLQIVKLRKSSFKVRGCLQSTAILRDKSVEMSLALSNARTLLDAWGILGDFLDRTLKARKCVRVKELFDDLCAISAINFILIDGKKVDIKVEEKEIQVRHRFLTARGCRLSNVVQEMQSLLQTHSESLEKLDEMEKDFIIREDCDLYYFDGEEHKLEYDLLKGEFKKTNSLVRKEEEEEYGCGICFVVYLENTIPRIRCEGCGRGYHASCLRDWLEAEGECKYLSHQILGKCLYCQSAIFCSCIK